MLEALRKKQEEKEAKRLAEQQAGTRTVLFRTTVKGKGGFVGEETTYSDGTTEMRVITAAVLDDATNQTNNTNSNDAPKPKKLIVRARLATKHPVVSLASAVILSAGDKSHASVIWSKAGVELCTGASYTPIEADVGATLKVIITFASDGGTTNSDCRCCCSFLEVVELETLKVLPLLPVRERLIISEGNETDSFRVGLAFIFLFCQPRFLNVIGTYNIMAPCHTRLDAYAFADPGMKTNKSTS